jgi:hypothetical protein
MGRRIATLRTSIGLAVALVLVLAGCGGGNPDPYAVVDQARTASYERIQLNLGFTVEVAAQTDPNFPEFQMPATSINVDPSWILAAAETTTGRFYLRLALPLDALGMGNQGMPFGVPFESIDLEVVNDGTDLYVKSPLLPMMLQGMPTGGVDGPTLADLSGWVRLGSAEGIGALVPMMFGMGLPGVPASVTDVLPAPGDIDALRSLLTELGATIEFVGTESIDGADQLHLKGGLNIVTLVQSERFLSLTGMPRDAIQGIVDQEGNVGVAADIWVNKASGRLSTLRLEVTSLANPVANAAITLRIAEPGPDITFAAPATFADVNLMELLGNPFPVPGVGVGGGDGGSGVQEIPEEVVDDILEDVGNELRSQHPDMP